MSQTNVLSNGPGTNINDSITSTPNRTRADSRDYLVQPGSAIALLPAIAEERFGGLTLPPFFGRSNSIEQSSKYGNPEGDKEVCHLNARRLVI